MRNSGVWAFTFYFGILEKVSHKRPLAGVDSRPWLPGIENPGV